MEKQVDLPRFDDVNAALNSGGPFMLSRWALNEIDLETIPQDKIHLIHDALLHNNYIKWETKNEQDLNFISAVIRDHKNLNTIELQFTHEYDASTIYTLDGLAAILQESIKIKQISLSRYERVRIAPLLRALKHCKNLEEIIIHFDPVEEDIEPLACVLSCEYLKKIEVDQIQTDLWKPIIPVLSEHKSLTRLTLHPCGPGGLHAINEILHKNTSIRELIIHDNMLEPTAVEDMPLVLNGLKNNTTLKSIYLSYVSNEVVDLFCKSLGHDQINITELRFVRVDISEDNCRVLNEALKTNTKLTHLEVYECDIDDAKCQLLNDGFSKVPKLTLGRGNISAASTKPLFERLKNSTNLTSLTLSMMHLYDDTCTFVADMLARNTTLTSLSLRDNYLKDEGLTCIYEAMVKNSTITALDLTVDYYDWIRDGDGMTAVKKMLTRNTSLKKLSAFCDPDIEDSLNYLCEGLKQNTSLNYLSLGVYQFSQSNIDTMQAKIEEVLKVNYALDTIRLEGIDKNESYEELLEPQLKRNALLKRNRQLKSEAQFKVAILSHNIARSREALAMLPREVWIEILSLVAHPGMEPFTDMVNKIFDTDGAK